MFRVLFHWRQEEGRETNRLIPCKTVALSGVVIWIVLRCTCEIAWCSGVTWYSYRGFILSVYRFSNCVLSKCGSNLLNVFLTNNVYIFFNFDCSIMTPVFCSFLVTCFRCCESHNFEISQDYVVKQDLSSQVCTRYLVGQESSNRLPEYCMCSGQLFPSHFSQYFRWFSAPLCSTLATALHPNLSRVPLEKPLTHIAWAWDASITLACRKPEHQMMWCVCWDEPVPCFVLLKRRRVTAPISHHMSCCCTEVGPSLNENSLFHFLFVVIFLDEKVLSVPSVSRPRVPQAYCATPSVAFVSYQFHLSSFALSLSVRSLFL